MSIIRLSPVLALVAVLAGSFPAVAQTAPANTSPSAAPAPGTPHHHHHNSFMHALNALNLTDAQKQQVTAFHDQERKANLNADSATRHANAATMRQQIMGILTSDQKTQLAAKMRHHGTPNTMAAPNPAASPASR